MGARGRMALLWGMSSGLIEASPALADHVFSCTLCGACSGLCPSGVDIREVIFHGRSILRKVDTRRRLLRFLTHFCMKRPKLSFKALSMVQHILFPYLYRKGVIPILLELPEYYLTDKHHVFTVSPKKGRVAIFTGCAVNYLFPHLGESLINVLHRLGYEVILPAGEVCCGAPLRALGLEKEAAKLAEKNFNLFSKLNVDAVLSLCPTCTLTLKREYPGLIGGGIEKTTDIASFFVDKLEPSQISQLIPPVKTALYHTPCHLKYSLGIEKEPKEIIKKIGIDLVKTPGERCCGFAGTFCFSHRELSEVFLHKCVEDYKGSPAEMIITSCPGCIMQLSREVRDRPVIHLIEAIEEAVFPESQT
jgi:glycolate oxidase iron-sulfur subunit